MRAILQRGPGFADEVSGLLDEVKPTLPVLLANLTTLGQILVTYNPSLEQILVVAPGYIAAQQAFGLPRNNPTGLPSGDFTLTVGDPPPCTVGFLPPSQWRNPEDTTTIDTPDGLYCKLPQDSPIAVRGARNYPCMGHPGKRAPTVEICDSDKPFEPMAVREHSLGPYPFDPNLVSQGIPIDDRVDFGDRIFAPTEGTPLPPGAVPAGTPPGPPPGQPLAPPPPGFAMHATWCATAGPACPRGTAAATTSRQLAQRGADTAWRSLRRFRDGGAVPAAPSAFGSNANGGPSVAVTHYDQNGRYLTPQGTIEQQTNLVAGGASAKTWKDMMPI